MNAQLKFTSSANNVEKQPAQKLLRIRGVSDLTGYSPSHIYTLARQGNFPSPRKLGPNTSVWLESEIVDWINERLGLTTS